MHYSTLITMPRANTIALPIDVAQWKATTSVATKAGLLRDVAIKDILRNLVPVDGVVRLAAAAKSEDVIQFHTIVCSLATWNQCLKTFAAEVLGLHYRELDEKHIDGQGPNRCEFWVELNFVLWSVLQGQASGSLAA